jgi:hypothetical protein
VHAANSGPCVGAPQRIRTSDLRLRSAHASEAVADTYARSRPLRDRALALLRQADETGAIPRADVEAVAREWIAVVGADAALRVLTSGTHEAADVVAFLSRIVDVTEPDDLANADDAEEGGAR